MACFINFKDQQVPVNNMQFSRLIRFAVELADQMAKGDERLFVEHMKHLDGHEFWPGRGTDIEEDFPDVSERKFWTRIFLDLSRLIFERKIGKHEHFFWQAQCIHQAHSIGLLFEDAVRVGEGNDRWSADSIDRREFDRVANGKIK